MTKYQVRRRALLLLLTVISITLSAQDFSADRELFDAYRQENMAVWKDYIDRLRLTEYRPATPDREQTDLLYEYGYCGYIVAEAKKEGKEALLPEAKQYVAQFREHVEAQKGQLPAGHYEMYLSAVMVYELRLHIALRPIKAMSLAKEATRLAPEDPLVLSYYGTSLFYAPKPFGSKSEALTWFEKAEEHFRDPQWEYCWVREATKMYIRQCHEKLGR